MSEDVPMKTVAIYARRSSIDERADFDKSTTRQIDDCKAYAKRKG